MQSLSKYDSKPKMILFDVGGTLFDDGVCVPVNGLARLRLAAKNPDVTSNEALAVIWDEYMNEISGLKSKSGITLDMPLSAAIKYVTMKSGLHFDISPAQQEEIFDRYNSSRKVIEGIPQLLDTLSDLSIRTSVISNNAMSGEGLSLAIRKWIPNEKFEFFLTSADILLCKPCKDIFLIAAAYAGLEPGECWYCGDGIMPDIYGGSGAGMSPVLLDAGAQLPFEICHTENGEYLAVNSWEVLNNHMRTLK